MKPSAGDWLLITLAGALVAASFVYLWSPRTERVDYAEIRSPYETVRVALSPDRTLEIRGKLGLSKLAIEHGRIRFVESPCPLKYCIHSGWLHRSGEFAACLPNAVSISLAGGGTRYDAVSY